jgi:hypothetical protein
MFENFHNLLHSIGLCPETVMFRTNVTLLITSIPVIYNFRDSIWNYIKNKLNL